MNLLSTTTSKVILYTFGTLMVIAICSLIVYAGGWATLLGIVIGFGSTALILWALISLLLRQLG